jgi:FkbM family methyltransferase
MSEGGGPGVLLRVTAVVADRTPYRVKNVVARTTARSRTVRRILALAHGDLRHEDVTIPLGAAAGLRFNSGDSVCGYTHGTPEPDVQDALARELSDGMVAYDIGANIGFFTMIAARAVGPQGRVLAFEPLPENVRWLRHNADINDFRQIEIVDAAVGAAAGTVGFESGATDVWARVSDSGEHRVRVLSIDDGIAEGSLPVPDVVKIDIEGAEVEALDGMRETLARHRPTVIVELHATMEPVRERLLAAGYGMERIDPRVPDVNGHLIARHAG